MSFDNKPEENQNPADQLSFNVGERSYDASTAATKIEAADTHIKTIETENQGYKDQIAALTAQVAQSTKIDDALAKLQQSPQESQPTEVTPSVSTEQIGAITTQKIEQYLAEQRVIDNEASATALATKTFQETGEKLRLKYGDKTDEAMATQATKLGISKEAIFDMAKNPATAQLLLNAMDVQSPVAQATPQSSFATNNQQEAPVHNIDWSKGGSKEIFAALQAARN